MRRPRGFGLVAAIVVLVILAALAAAIVAIGTTQQVTSAQDVQSARAWLAARAGNEWGLHQALKGPWGACANDSETLDLTADTGLHVTVRCDSWPYNEGETVPGTPRAVRIYRIEAVACSVSTCPPSDLDLALVAGAGYVERTRIALAVD